MMLKLQKMYVCSKFLSTNRYFNITLETHLMVVMLEHTTEHECERFFNRKAFHNKITFLIIL